MNSNDMSCEQALRMLALYLDQELAPGENEAVSMHLQRCKSCYSRAEFESRLKGQLAALRRADVGADFEQRIRVILHSFGTV